MFKSLPISRKIGLSFLVIVLTVAVMMGVFWFAMTRIQGSTHDSALAQQVYSTALKMEVGVLRQNSQVRGFLITADKSYLKQYRDAREDGIEAAAELIALLPAAADRAKVAVSRDRIADWRRKWGDPLIAQTMAGDAAGAQAMLRASSKTVTMTPILKPLRDLRADAEQRLVTAGTAQDGAIDAGMSALVIGGIVMIAVAIGFSALLGRLLAKPVVRLTGVMSSLAAGDNAVAVPDGDRTDEIGSMARAVAVFRDAAIAKAQSDAEQEAIVRQVGDALSRVADTDLTVRLSGFPASYGKLERDFNDAMAALTAAFVGVSAATGEINASATDIRQASDDLSQRTEQQAASLEETAAAMDEFTTAVRQAAASASRADTMVGEARVYAEQSGEVVRRTVEAIGKIERSSAEISDIIGVIDGIAFQTNLLALNAGVEAARAGDAGKGFAVVASEVRALAQRSADAAKDVKMRIGASSQQVQAGVALVSETGEALNRIISRVTDISALVSEIATAAERQSEGLHQINTAVGEMDIVTQQNAAMVEESTAAVRSLASEANGLAQEVSRFRLADTAGATVTPIAAARQSQRKVPAARVQSRRAGGSTAAAAVRADDDWSAF